MAPEREELAAETRRHHLSSWFDIESAAVVTILLGIFQLLLCGSLIQIDQFVPKFFYLLPLVLGIVIVAGGSFTMASQKNKSKLMLRGCACSNVLGLLGSLLAFCIYVYALHKAKNLKPCLTTRTRSYYDTNACPLDKLADYTWSLTLQLLLYDTVTVVMHLILSVCAFKTLKEV